jgi:outer membrane lipoprotein-sorting protein
MPDALLCFEPNWATVLISERPSGRGFHADVGECPFIAKEAVAITRCAFGHHGQAAQHLSCDEIRYRRIDEHIMTYSKRNLVFCFCVTMILAGTPAMVIPSSAESAGELPANEILKNAQEKYASLTSYSDTGRTVSEINGTRLTTTFKVKLARPGFYLIEWEQPVHASYTNSGAVWSAGDGDFMRMGSNLQKRASREEALGSATGVSGSAAATIPGTFFRMNWGNQLDASVSQSTKQLDEKVGDVDCYVFTSQSKGRTSTLYIGKKDFLIHQVKTVTSDEAMKVALAEAAKSHPEIRLPQPQVGPQGVISTETHENIVVNEKYSNGIFVPHDAGK